MRKQKIENLQSSIQNGLHTILVPKPFWSLAGRAGVWRRSAGNGSSSGKRPMPSVWLTSAVCVQNLSEYKTVSEWWIVLIFTLSHQSAKRFLSLHFRPVLSLFSELFFGVCVCLCVCQYRDYVKITNMTDFILLTSVSQFLFRTVTVLISAAWTFLNICLLLEWNFLPTKEMDLRSVWSKFQLHFIGLYGQL